MDYSIKYNRTTNHIAGIECATQGAGNDNGGAVSYFAESACGSLTRGRLADGKAFEDLAEALAAARIAGGRKLCKNCEKAALRAIEILAAAEVVEVVEIAAPAPAAEVAPIAETEIFELAEVTAPVTVQVDMQSSTQGIVTVAGHAVQGLVGDDGRGRLYAEDPYADVCWHQSGHRTARQAATALARQWGFQGPLRVTVHREY